MVQSCPEASPVKWHQAHTTCFFETFVLRPFLADYEVFREEFRWLFNGYYSSPGGNIPDDKLRASFSRPSLDQVLAFRAHVDQEMERLLAGSLDEEPLRRIILGLNHEQQYQELVPTDIKHAFFSNPLLPPYAAAPLAAARGAPVLKLRWRRFNGGLVEIGRPPQAAAPLDFCFDNETPRHKVYLEPFHIANRTVTCREYLEFMSDDAYTRSEYWLSDGWETVTQTGWQAPLYWEREASDETGWRVFTLRGWHGLSTLLDTPVCHISLFEADAFARWRGCRLPTEAEWEYLAGQTPPRGNLLGTGRMHPAMARRGYGATFWRLLGMDGQLVLRLSGIQAPSWSAGRIQRQVYVRSDGIAWRILRHTRRSHARDLSQFPSTCDAVAVHWNSLGNLKGIFTLMTT